MAFVDVPLWLLLARRTRLRGSGFLPFTAAGLPAQARAELF